MFTFCFESIKKEALVSRLRRSHYRSKNPATICRPFAVALMMSFPVTRLPAAINYILLPACWITRRPKTDFKIDASDDRCARLSFNHNSPPLPERAPGIKRGGLRRLLVRTRCHENYRFEKFKTVCYFSNLTWVRKGKGYATIKATVQPLCWKDFTFKQHQEVLKDTQNKKMLHYCQRFEKVFTSCLLSGRNRGK